MENPRSCVGRTADDGSCGITALTSQLAWCHPAVATAQRANALLMFRVRDAAGSMRCFVRSCPKIQEPRFRRLGEPWPPESFFELPDSRRATNGKEMRRRESSADYADFTDLKNEGNESDEPRRHHGTTDGASRIENQPSTKRERSVSFPFFKSA